MESDEAQKGLWTLGRRRQHLLSGLLYRAAVLGDTPQCPPDMHGSLHLIHLQGNRGTVFPPEQEGLSQGSSPSTPQRCWGHPLGSRCRSSKSCRPGFGRRRSWTSEQAEVTHRRLDRRGGGLGLTNEAMGLGQMGTAGSAAGEVL